MTTMNPEIDLYMAEGCGRCALYRSPDCKAIRWQKELAHLRSIVLKCDVTEELKWSVPCYTHEGKNIFIMSALKEFVCISFFKGALLKDPEGVLVQQTENMQAARLLKFTSIQEMEEMAPVIKAYIDEAIMVEKAGLKVAFTAKDDLDYPEELIQACEEDPELLDAFEALTPGRKRGYILHFSKAKQSQTRMSRIQKSRQKILDGKGVFDR